MSGAAGALGSFITYGMDVKRQEATNSWNAAEARRADARALENSKAMAMFNKNLQMQMWNDTNYKAQIDQMKSAGINPGMMYGMGGGGGATANITGGNGQGTAARGEAVKMNADGLGMVLMQAKLNEAQVENIEADTEKKKVEADKLAGVDTEKAKAETGSLLQGIENAKAQKTMQEMLNYEQGASQEDRLEQIGWMTQKAEYEARRAGAGAKVDEATVQSNIDRIRTIAVQETLKNGLIKEQTQLTEEQQKEVNARIEKMTEEIKQGWKGLSQKEKELKIKQFGEEMKAAYPGIGNVAGDWADDLARWIERIAGNNPDHNERRYNYKE